MMTEPSRVERLVPPPLAAITVASTPARDDGEALRAWRVSQLAALGAVVAAAWNEAARSQLVGWTVFVALNLLLYGFTRRLAESREQRALELGTTAALGAAWGGALVLLPSAAGAATLAVLFAAVFMVAVAALPALAARRGAYAWFVLPASAVLLLALVHDATHPALAGWAALAVAVLLTVASGYYTVLDQVTGMVRRFVRVLDPLDAIAAGEGWSRLGARAERALTGLHRLRAQHGRDQRLIEAFGDGVLVTDAGGAIEDLNAAAMTLLGCTRDTLIGQPLAAAVMLAQRAQPEPALTGAWWTAVRDSGGTRQADDDLELVRADGARRGVEARMAALHDSHGRFIGVSLQLRDVSARRREAARLAWRANHDPLTGAVNRAEFERRLERLLHHAAHARRAGDEANHTLLFIDLDKFKFVNDSYGHAAGDYVLRTLAALLDQRLREADVLGRLGGDEFCVLLHSCAVSHAGALADTMRAAVSRHEFRWHGVALPVSISVGVVAVAADAVSGAALLRAADSACYAAKHSGRNRVELFAHADDTAVRHAHALRAVQSMQNALRGGHVTVLRHGIRTTAAPYGACCWEIGAGIAHADGTPLPRHEVTDLATRFRLNTALDRWLLTAALDRIAQPQDDATLVLVPLTAQSLTDDAFLQGLVDEVRARPALATRLGFTLPAAALSADARALRYFVSTLKQDGCRFMVADLGLGGSAVEVAKTIQFDYLGIAGSFIEHMQTSSVDYEIVLALSRIAHALGMQAIALDVTSDAERDMLAAMGVALTRDRAASA